MIQKKFIYYICCLDVKTIQNDKKLNTLYSNKNFSEKELKKLGIKFFKEIPSTLEPISIASSTDTKGVISFKKLGDLMYNFIDNAITDKLIENDDYENLEKFDENYNTILFQEIFSRLMEETFIFKKNKQDGTFKLVNTDILLNCYKQTISEKGMDFFSINNEQTMNNIADDNCIIAFYEVINQAMTKFGTGVLIFDNGDVWDVNKQENNIWFGREEVQDSIFKARLWKCLITEAFSCTLRVITDSKKGDENFVEIYGFYSYINENNQFIINNTTAEELKISYSFNHITKQPLSHLDTDIYCDLTGERIINF